MNTAVIRIRRAAYGLLALFLTAPAAIAEERLRDLPGYIDASLADWGLPGMAVAVVENDAVIFARGFGVRELGKPDRIDASTLFQVGSTSKAFAAASIGVLVDQGELGWDDPVVKFLPWFEMRDPWVTQQVTIRDLLVHRSGLRDAAYPVLAPMTAREVARKIRLLDNALPFRQQHHYTNLGYGLIGLIVEAVSGKSWAEFVEGRLLEPLGMAGSGATPYDFWSAEHVAPVFFGTAPAGAVGHEHSRHGNVAMPHGWARDGNRRVLPWMSYDNMAAAGNVVSSGADMAKWIRMHLAGGSIGDRQVLSAATLEEIFSPQIRADGYFLFADDGYDFYAMGWERETFRGHTYISHGGGIFGFPAYVALVPEAKIGIVVLANGSLWTPYYPHQAVVARILERLLDLDAENWHGAVMARTQAIEQQVDAHFATLAAKRDADAPPDRALPEFAGRYEDELTGTLAVTVAGDGLRLAVDGAGAFAGTLEHYRNNEFQLWFDGGDGGAWSNAMATFVASDAGDVVLLDLGFLGQFRRPTPARTP